MCNIGWKRTNRVWKDDVYTWISNNGNVYIVDLKNGTSGHLFFGHGPDQKDFVKRDFGTTNEMFYEKKMKADTLVNPHFYPSKSYL